MKGSTHSSVSFKSAETSGHKKNMTLVWSFTKTRFMKNQKRTTCCRSHRAMGDVQ